MGARTIGCCSIFSLPSIGSSMRRSGAGKMRRIGKRCASSAGSGKEAAVDVKVRQKALQMLSNGVYVLTSRSEDRYGAATVSWVSQASFKPPLIMAAIRRESNVFRCLAQNGSAVLHIGGGRQQEIARRIFFPTLAAS